MWTRALKRMIVLYAGWGRRELGFEVKPSRSVGPQHNEGHSQEWLRYLGGLGAFEEAGAELGKFGDEIFSFTAGESGGVDFRGKEDGGGDVGAALQTVLFGSPWKFE